MYEVWWTVRSLEYDYDSGRTFDDRNEAWSFYGSYIDGEDIDSVGLYYIDGDGNEKELATWSR